MSLYSFCKNIFTYTKIFLNMKKKNKRDIKTILKTDVICMKKIAIFFGSTTGTTEYIANRLAELLSADIYNVADNPADKISEYNNLIFGTSTWGIGDLQDDWQDFLPNIKNADLSGKCIALFGTGDSLSYPDSFTDGMGILYEEIVDKGCKIIGSAEPADYTFDTSRAVQNDKFVGLALDEDNESSKTEERLLKWIEQIKNEFN